MDVAELNQEIISAAGFKTEKAYDGVRRYTKDGVEFYGAEDTDSWEWEYAVKVNNEDVMLKYAHELQNEFYKATGKELEFNL